MSKHLFTNGFEEMFLASSCSEPVEELAAGSQPSLYTQINSGMSHQSCSG